MGMAMACAVGGSILFLSQQPRRVLWPNAHPSPLRVLRCVAASRGSQDLLLQAAKLTVDRYVRRGMVVGVGSGPASALALNYLASQVEHQPALSNIILALPQSLVSSTNLPGLTLTRYTKEMKIDFAFNDADAVQEGMMLAVIGRRRGLSSFTEEKSMARSSRKVAFIVSNANYAQKVDGSVPVLVESASWMDTAEQIDDLFLGEAEVWRRPAFGSAGPTGGDFPYVTGDGHYVLDIIFTSPILNLGQVAQGLEGIPGVVDHGILRDAPFDVVIVSEEGVHVADST